MADVNNALAAQIQVPQIDVAGTLAKVGQIKLLNSENDLKQQELKYRQGVLDRNDQYYPTDKNTLEEVTQRHLDNAGRIGSILANRQDLQARQDAIQAAKDSGYKINPLVEQHILTAPDATVKQYGQNMQQAGQPSQASIEQTGIPAGKATKEQGKFIPASPPESGAPVTSRTELATGQLRRPLSAAQKYDDDNVRQGLETPTPEQRARGVTGPANGKAPNPQGATKAPQPTPDPTAVLQPSIQRNPDGTLSYNTGPSNTLRASAAEQFKKSGENFANSGPTLLRIGMMEHAFDNLNSEGWSSTGSLTPTKMEAAKNINSIMTSLGMQPALDPNKVSFWEDLRKETRQAGFALAKSLGSNEAASVVESTMNAVPNETNQYLGAKRIMSGMKMAIQREQDFYQFQQQYAARHHGDTYGADVEFNRQRPPELYAKLATANVIPEESVKILSGQPTPERKATFDRRYGSGMADFVLSATNGR